MVRYLSIFTRLLKWANEADEYRHDIRYRCTVYENVIDIIQSGLKRRSLVRTESSAID